MQQDETGFLITLRRLAAAMILSGYETIEHGRRADPQSAFYHDYQRAVRWFELDDDDGNPLSYRACCALLDLNPAAGRAAMARLLAGDDILSEAAARAALVLPDRPGRIALNMTPDERRRANALTGNRGINTRCWSTTPALQSAKDRER